MAKGYWIATSDVTDMDGMRQYRMANRATLERHGARFLVAGGRQGIREGNAASRQTVVEFASYDAAVAAFDDPEYQAASKLRRAAASGSLVIVEGFDPPPGF